MRTFLCALLLPVAVAAASSDDGPLKFSDATFLAAHNAHASLATAEGILEPLGTNQQDDILFQLRRNGVRGLLLDVALDPTMEAEPLRLVHGSSFLTLDFGGFRTTLGSNLIPFLEEDDDAIVSLFLQTVGDDGNDAAAIRAAILTQLRVVFSSMTVNGAALRDLTFKHDDPRWADHADWPTLAELRAAGQRLFVFADRAELADAAHGFLYNRQVLSENHWEGLADCEARYMWRYARVSLPDNDRWTRLFFMNHFCCGSGPGARDDVVGDDLLGGGHNGWGVLYPRVRQCMAGNGGFKPNFIALDWVEQSAEAAEVRDYLNFGGALGSGQACNAPSHCATASCNAARGVCQCQQCSSDGEGVCLGCDVGQYCAARGGAAANWCQDKAGFGGPSQSDLGAPGQSEPGAPAQSEPGAPTPNGPGAANPGESDAPTPNTPISQYCGEEYFGAVASCNDSVQCPGGNDDCPEGQVCYAGVDCTPYPTASPRPTPSPSATATPGGAPGLLAELGLTRAPAGGAGAPGLLAELGLTQAPADASWIDELGLTRVPTASPTTTSSPTATPPTFDPANQYYCGDTFDDAQENCYVNAPCPNGSPRTCGGGTCYGGIVCAMPPPTAGPVAPAEVPAEVPAEAPPGGGASTSLPGSPSDGNQPQGWDSYAGGGSEPFNLDSFQNRESSGPRWVLGDTAAVIVTATGLAGLLW